MAVHESGRPDGQAARRGPERVIPTTKVNVSFPFSQIKVQEPGEDLAALAALAALVEELAELVARSAHGPKAEKLRLRAHELAGRLS